MPPAFLNHRVPTACGTPTPTAASSLAVPAAIAAQNRRRSSRPATGGRPGENKRTRPERSERRFRMFIATPVKMLRRPHESAQYVSIKYTERLAEAEERYFAMLNDKPMAA
jgi:putative transposase